MSEKDVFNYIKDLGCCRACCIRYLGIRNPKAYENLDEYVSKYTDDGTSEVSHTTRETEAATLNNGNSSEAEALADGAAADGSAGPAHKRRRWAVCASCVGVLQPQTWTHTVDSVKEALHRKRYLCKTFACALGAPGACALRERLLVLLLKEKYPAFDVSGSPTPLKEAWKWGFGLVLSRHLALELDSGAVAPLLVTVNLEYPDDAEELKPLQELYPEVFSLPSRPRRWRGRTPPVPSIAPLSRRTVEEATQRLLLADWRRHIAAAKGEGEAVAGGEVTEPTAPVAAVSVVCVHEPIYLGGRYIKLSRSLSQTAWVVRGERMMESSVQEIICEPIAKLYDICAADAEHRLKLMSAGREDVDVRCLGDGRPFAVEISDPNREPTATELQLICDSITNDGRVIVKKLQVISKEELTKLKLGEETKCKSYEALCVKLTAETARDDETGTLKKVYRPTAVTQQDIDAINSYTNTRGAENGAGVARDGAGVAREGAGVARDGAGVSRDGAGVASDGAGDGKRCERVEGEGKGRVMVVQRTPLRVLHRRPLLERTRRILSLHADLVPGHPELFTIKVETEAGTYVKEWVHGELARNKPSLCDAVGGGARLDILALDVTAVHLDWPTSGQR